ncbi:MAG: iron ABC transporter permease, partial [Acidimicrobiia bacterium]|nr:iron ABC transporter permease [Acidimicrobiia bacterium]
ADALPFVDVAHGLTETQLDILWQLRLPRVVLGATVGATLAISGAAYQGVFRNPLADPYLLGVAAGAGFGATLAFVFAPGAAVGPLELLPIAAFGGALVGVGLTYGVGRALGDRSNAALILAGVAVASFLTAVQTFIQQRNTDTLREVYSWILGSISTLGWSEVLLALPYAAIAAVAILLHRRLLDVLAVGEEESKSLGVSTGRVRVVVVIAASLGTAAAVAVSGLIGFVGIIVPHTVRLLTGWSYRVIIPLSALFGGAFLVLADLVARSVMAPAELPIGVVTAFLGAPFFAVVMRSARRMR